MEFLSNRIGQACILDRKSRLKLTAAIASGIIDWHTGDPQWTRISS